VSERVAYEVASAEGRTLRATALLPHPARGTVIICHGFKGFSRWGFFPHFAEALAREGLRAVRFDFSGSGVGADGESFTETGAFEANTFTRELEDLAAIETDAQRRGWLDVPYGLLGHSRGGGTAILHAAGNRAVGALVTLAAISRVRRWSDAEERDWRTRGFREIVNTRTGQILRVGTALLDDVIAGEGGRLAILGATERLKAPWLIIHGAADMSVPVDDAHALADAAPDARLLIIEGASHTFDIAHPMRESSPALDLAVSETVEWMRRELT
jgi:dienelactone hydrolase